MQPAPLPCGTVTNCRRRSAEAFKMHSSESRIKHGEGGTHIQHVPRLVFKREEC